MLKIYKFKHFGPYRRESVYWQGGFVNLTGFGFLPRLYKKARPWLGLARVRNVEPPAQARQHTANRMQKDYNGNAE